MVHSKHNIPVIRRITSILFWASALIVLLYTLKAIPEYLQGCKFLNESITIILGICGAMSCLSMINGFLDTSGEHEIYHAGLLFLSFIEIVLLVYFLRTRIFGFDGFYVFHDSLSTATIVLGLWLLIWLVIISDKARRTILFSNKFCERPIRKDEDDFNLMLGIGIFISVFSILSTVSVELVDKFILGV